ncbi:hypothetical protein BW723_11330 [Polaribacter reichenbachii]|uniref:DUF1573 domain-containing protein n=1 Tax=Polaribacter reichenbachii TaxID=996801 RepID=A0A1B8TQ25_9FLAO|nr:DUF1573 domain-containing protein [Polaribacter reichenbachii]APZ46837.1 hypothetical protein BW723_11330 [Polaribacter reichenbachii]AUC17480.1 hypothetical protein BTO17_01775 [Polaribacter reichenbachii]OBY61644.1 hypothetical protein LPB301_16440 [Polaribacter reichenbachii]
MKAFFTLLFIGFISFATSAQEFKFETESINYGKIDKGSNGERVFEFTNVGNKPLIIKDIKSSCGCTVPKKPEKPIMPGEKGEIKVSYDTRRVGGFSKSITIFSNAKNPRKIIRIKGSVNKEISLEKEKSLLSDS